MSSDTKKIIDEQNMAKAINEYCNLYGEKSLYELIEEIRVNRNVDLSSSKTTVTDCPSLPNEDDNGMYNISITGDIPQQRSIVVDENSLNEDFEGIYNELLPIKKGEKRTIPQNYSTANLITPNKREDVKAETIETFFMSDNFRCLSTEMQEKIKSAIKIYSDKHAMKALKDNFGISFENLELDNPTKKILTMQ